MARVTVQAVVDLEALIRTIEAVPGMAELPFSVALRCKFQGGDITCDTVEELKLLAEGIIAKRLKAKD